MCGRRVGEGPVFWAERCLEKSPAFLVDAGHREGERERRAGPLGRVGTRQGSSGENPRRQGGGLQTRKIPPASAGGKQVMESLILAQNERWRRVLSMQVGRQGGFGPPRAADW